MSPLTNRSNGMDQQRVEGQTGLRSGKKATKRVEEKTIPIPIKPSQEHTGALTFEGRKLEGSFLQADVMQGEVKKIVLPDHYGIFTHVHNKTQADEILENKPGTFLIRRQNDNQLIFEVKTDSQLSSSHTYQCIGSDEYRKVDSFGQLMKDEPKLSFDQLKEKIEREGSVSLVGKEFRSSITKNDPKLNKLETVLSRATRLKAEEILNDGQYLIRVGSEPETLVISGHKDGMFYHMRVHPIVDRKTALKGIQDDYPRYTIPYPEYSDLTFTLSQLIEGTKKTGYHQFIKPLEEEISSEEEISNEIAKTSHEELESSEEITMTEEHEDVLQSISRDRAIAVISNCPPGSYLLRRNANGYLEIIYKDMEDKLNFEYGIEGADKELIDNSIKNKLKLNDVNNLINENYIGQNFKNTLSLKQREFDQIYVRRLYESEMRKTRDPVASADTISWVDRTKSESILKNREGYFLIRKGSDKGFLAISSNVDGTIRHSRYVEIGNNLYSPFDRPAALSDMNVCYTLAQIVALVQQIEGCCFMNVSEVNRELTSLCLNKSTSSANFYGPRGLSGHRRQED